MVIAALQQALGSRRARPGLIFHSDRGSQYGSGTFRELLRQAGLRQSMSARANPYHNAWPESFIGTRKTEMLQNGTFSARADANTEVFADLESYYNPHRKHSSSDTSPPPLSRPSSTPKTQQMLVQNSVASPRRVPRPPA